MAEAALERRPESPGALRFLSELRRRAADVEASMALLEKLVASGRGTSFDHNNLVWCSLFMDPIPEQALDHARRAVGAGSSEAALHTLAVVHAELGQTGEALEIFRKLLDSRGQADPEPHDWYIMGRLAEHYGEPELARDMYARVEPDEDEDLDRTSTRHLADRRIAALDSRRAELLGR